VHGPVTFDGHQVVPLCDAFDPLGGPWAARNDSPTGCTVALPGTPGRLVMSEVAG
jgi:hypothetical protein